MSLSESNTANVFTADVNGGERPLFRADTTKIIDRLSSIPTPHWQGFGTQNISSDPFDPVQVHLSVFVAKGVAPGTYEIGDSSGNVWASYVIQRSGSIEAYLSIDGDVTLKAVPSPDNKRLEGTVSFTGKYQDKQVRITNGQFNLIEQA
ncbi:hypothetical protein PSH79_14705 [Pseudomonas sp. FP2196]|uniref:hypothetical protein n=1 Tax=Pseudomonas sp. FP2196 TaxID=2954086 RepID=UPI00273570AC|nr:hypothetical protein [Pseudomonas sp. FP2196]WLH33195.1 hypothetical protein PSH79_14705 [Pseudomonas sp. FP2196]